MWIIDKFGNSKYIPNTRFNRLMQKLHAKDGEDGGGGSGGEQLTEQQKIDKAVQDATSGLKSTNATLLEEKKALAAVQRQLESLGGIEAITALKEFQTKVANDEILKLASEGKHNEAIAKATERLTVTHNAEKLTLQQEKEEAAKELTSTKEHLRALIVDNNVVAAFSEVKGISSALPDVLYRAKSVFTVENNVPVARNEKGEMIQGGKGPLTVKEWVEGLKKTAPHLFPGSQGSNFDGGDGDSSDDNLSARLVEASRISPTALRLEKKRQAELKGKR